MLLEQIKSDSLVARKSGDKIAATLLITLLSEAANIGKNAGNRQTTDAEVISTVKKFIKNTDEVIETLNATTDSRLVIAQCEKELLANYLPKQLDAQDLTNAISVIVNKNNLPKDPKQMGVIMKELKTLYEGQYDGQMASKLIKEMLS